MMHKNIFLHDFKHFHNFGTTKHAQQPPVQPVELLESRPNSNLSFPTAKRLRSSFYSKDSVEVSLGTNAAAGITATKRCKHLQDEGQQEPETRADHTV